MRASQWIIAAACLAALVGGMADAAEDAPQPRGPVLRLPNGDFLSGKLSYSKDANVIAWKAPFAERAFRFPLSVISAAHFPQSKEGSARVEADQDAAYTVELVGGDVLAGKLVQLTDEELQIDSGNFGRLVVDRSHVQRISRGGLGGAFHYLGPEGLAAWNATDGWSDESGQLVIDKPGTAILNTLPIPQQACIEVDLSWKQSPDFSLHFGGDGELPTPAQEAMVHRVVGNMVVAERRQTQEGFHWLELFSLETWDGALVLVREGQREADIAAAQSLQQGPGSVQLRIYYDHKAGSVAVYTSDRRLLAQVKVEIDPKLTRRRGLRLVNTKGDVRLEHLAVREWNGSLPSEGDRERSYVERADGTIIHAETATFDAARNEFVIPQEAGEPLRLRPEQLDHLRFKSDQPEPKATARLTFIDGSRLSGDLLGVKTGRLRLKRDGVVEPMEVAAAKLRSIASLIPYQPAEALAGRSGRLETKDSRIHGMLVDAEGKDGRCLAWHPHGSATSSNLQPGVSGRIIYRDLPKVEDAETLAATQAAARMQAQAAAQQPRRRGLIDMLNPFGGRNQPQRPIPVVYSGSELIWLRGGDRLPCQLKHINDEGLEFESPMVEATFLPHEAIKAWESVGGQAISAIDPKKRERLLTLPRMQRSNPPTHLVESRRGDFLRGRLESMDDKTLTMEVRLEPKAIKRDTVMRIIWLEELEPKQGEVEQAANEEPAEDAEPPKFEPQTLVQAVRRDGVRLTFVPERVEKATVHGTSELLGTCQVEVNDVDQLLLGQAIEVDAREMQYSGWQLRHAPDPRFVSESGEPGAPAATPEIGLVGKPAPDFKLELLEGGELQLSKERGHVVVLDFWASWCGPCMQSMPQLDDLARELEGEEVRFYAVNLQEDRDTVAAALERLSVMPKAVLDIDGAAAEKFGVTAIPQTVVIDREGKVSALFVGARPDFVDSLRTAVQAALTAQPGE
jgi:thiol-disulfide isomerase/thioredoxin